MAAMSTYLANKVLDHILKNTSYSPPATVYIGLYTSNPDNDNSGSEVSGNNYSRTAMAFSSASAKATSNSGVVVSAVASGSWGTITHFGILDASTSGNLLYYGAFTASKTITNGEAAYFAAGEIDIAIT
jgi:ABC-type transport system involved in cytochrome c biogenesis permease subunit